MVRSPSPFVCTNLPHVGLRIVCAFRSDIDGNGLYDLQDGFCLRTVHGL